MKPKLMSWIAHDKRTQKELPFKLEPGVWYTLKLRAANEDGKAVLQGKQQPVVMAVAAHVRFDDACIRRPGDRVQAGERATRVRVACCRS